MARRDEVRRLRVARAGSDRAFLTHALLMAGELELMRDDMPKAERLLLEALAIGRSRRGLWDTIVPLLGLAVVARRHGDARVAASRCSEALDLVRSLASVRLRGACLAIASIIVRAVKQNMPLFQ